ncbi:MAG: hypothetical protein ACN6NV_08500 [Acinetobacter gandensis]|uniref:hypothetical protein n=1 Tax=Acinetobacter gandensis TaxID=1443941 RepID=UPI003CFE409D
MENLLLTLAQNSDKVSIVMTFLMALIVSYSFFMTRKMFKERKKAEDVYVESLLKNKEFIELLRSSDRSKFHVEIHPERNLVILDGEDIFIHTFENLDSKTQKQIEPALFQANKENRKAYLNKVVNEAKKVQAIESHC